MRTQIFVGLALAGCLAQEFAHADMVTLWCSGSVFAENTAGQAHTIKVATSVTFDEDARFLSIASTDNMEQGAKIPYKQIDFSDAYISWDGEIEPLWGIGKFFGKINRMTGEMTTYYLGQSRSRPNMVTIRGQFICERQVGSRF